MSRKYASAKYTLAECDRCGFVKKLKDLKEIFIRDTATNIKVCSECYEPDHPQNRQGLYPVDDPQAVQEPRPETNLDKQRNFQYGFNPVGLNNPLGLQGLEDDLKGAGQVGSVTITTTQE